MRVVLASGNLGKVAELKRLLPEWIEITTSKDLGVELPEETGKTFLENALIKARAVASAVTMISIADDSGLEVDALHGEPGVRSARFAGDGASDAQNNAQLLARLEGVETSKRTARFRSVVAVVAPDGTEFHDEGTVDGEILTAPRGDNGFGYDPLFRPLGHEQTFAQLSLDQKNDISHRGKAFRNVAERLVPFIQAHQTNGSLGAHNSGQASR